MSDDRSAAEQATEDRYGAGGPQSDAGFWTFLVFVDRTDLLHVQNADAEAYVWRAIQDEARIVDLGDGATEKLLARAITLQSIDLNVVAEEQYARLATAREQAKQEAEAAHAARLPKLLQEVRLDALLAVYERDLERRAGLVVLAWWLRATWRRWVQKRRWRR